MGGCSFNSTWLPMYLRKNDKIMKDLLFYKQDFSISNSLFIPASLGTFSFFSIHLEAGEILSVESEQLDLVDLMIFNVDPLFNTNTTFAPTPTPIKTTTTTTTATSEKITTISKMTTTAGSTTQMKGTIFC